MRAKSLGFTLIELLLVLAIMMGLGALELQKMKKEAEDTLAKSAGVEIGKASEAMGVYISRHMNRIQLQADPNCVPTAVPGICEFNLLSLVQEGLMPTGWTTRNDALKKDYEAFVRIIPGGAGGPSENNLEGLIFTSTPWLDGGASGDAKTAALSAAARAAGPSGGVSQANGAIGLFGAWAIPAAAGYPGLSDGQLAAQTVIQASTLDAFLPRDGSRPMTGNLNMGGYRINNAQDMELLGPNSLQRNKNVSSLMPNWVLKGVHTVADYGMDPANGTVPRPVCPDSDGFSTGLPRIIVKMTSMHNEMFGGYSYGEPRPDPNAKVESAKTLIPAYGGWAFYALEDGASNTWRTYIRRFYDNGYIGGEGLAEVYCYYP